MAPKDNLLWSEEEYKAIIGYKKNLYQPINVLLSDNVTMREKNANNKRMPQSKEEFEEILDAITSTYSAIKKNYIVNGSQQYGKILFRGTRSGKTDMSFLSTSDSVNTALDFVKIFKENGTLLVIDSQDVPWIDISSVVPSGDGIEDEPEILFLPSKINQSREINLAEALDVAKKQGEKIPAEAGILRRYASTKCVNVSLEEFDYSTEKTDLSKEDLCNMFEEYKSNLNIIKTADEGTPEYSEAFKRILEFKKNCCTWIHQEFHEINQSIDGQISKEDTDIQLSSEYNMEEVHIGNTGKMYLVSDKEEEKEYYFKPAVSKDGSPRPYRAHIQESAYDIQKIINPDNAVRCNVAEVQGMFGAIQEKVSIDKDATRAFRRYINTGKGEISPEIIDQAMDEYLVDFCLCNYDSHSRNFIIDTDGKLRGIDKEQSFRYIDKDSERDMMFSTNYNEEYGEDPSIYNILFERMKSGEISYKHMDNLRYRASRLSQYPDDEYRKIFEEYAYGKSKSPEEAEALLDDILRRKHGILHNVEMLHEDIYNEWYTNRPREVKTPISMKSVVSNAITQGISTEHVASADKVLENPSLEKEGVTKDD